LDRGLGLRPTGCYRRLASQSATVVVPRCALGPGSKRCVGEPGAEVNSLVITDDFTWVMVGRQDRADQAEGS
jgi:hypothetical protein